ncbi:alpha/beta fold hydrolase [Bradyrhizobium elkanii]|uniref:alpha/beta fold hydrolase n=1 Tax=Bradyrhizobium elkanii TaxID=29448 RepID=UPI001BA91AF8|nr:alpha/beta hydrolase [Bradyrhizobium elkanii]MBR1161928.1 alpha/beta hydrolase [Bradyrhizobium elkanii]
MLQDRHGTIDYSEQGAGPTIVFVPGSWSTQSAWGAITARLANRFRTVRTSLPGYGGTRERRTMATASIDRQAETLEAVVRHTGGPVHLVGHSVGALACIDLALCGTTPLMSLTLIEPVTFGLLRQAGELALHEQFIAVRDAYVRSIENGEKDAVQRFVDYLAGERSFSALPPRMRDDIVRAAPTHVLDISTSFDPSVAALGNILLPSLVIRGNRSAESLQTSADILSRAMANASLRTIAGASHFMTATHPADLAELISDHVLKTESLAWSSLSFAAPFGLPWNPAEPRN